MTQALGPVFATFNLPITSGAAIPWRYAAASDHAGYWLDAAGAVIAPANHGAAFSVLPEGDTAAGAGTLNVLVSPPTGAAQLVVQRKTPAVQLYEPSPGAEGVAQQMDRMVLRLQELGGDTLTEQQTLQIISAANAAAITARIGPEIHDRILAQLLRTGRDEFHTPEILGSRRSWRKFKEPFTGAELVDDDSETFPASLNSTALGKSLQYLSRLALAHKSRTSELVPFIEHFANTLLAMQWNVTDKAISGGFKLAPAEPTASTFGTAQAGLGLIYAYRATGAQQFLLAAIRAADFIALMHDPNPRYTELYGVSPIPNRTVGSITFDGFLDRINQDDKITATSTTWNVVACDFLQAVYEETGTTSYRDIADAALEFYAYPVLNLFDVFLVETTASTYVGIEWNLAQRLDVADHSFRYLGGLTTTSSAFVTSGTVAAVSGLNVTLAASASAVNGAYVGMVLDTLSGAGSAQGRMIVSYDGATKTATIEKDFATAINGTTTYRIGWGVNTVGTDQIEYGLATLHRRGWPLAEITAVYEEIMTWPTTSTGSFGAAFNPRGCLAGYVRRNSGIYGGADRHFGGYYDGVGAGELLALKYAIAPADYLAALAIVNVIPDQAALLDENYIAVYTPENWTTVGTIPLAVAGLGILDVAAAMEA